MKFFLSLLLLAVVQEGVLALPVFNFFRNPVVPGPKATELASKKHCEAQVAATYDPVINAYNQFNSLVHQTSSQPQKDLSPLAFYAKEIDNALPKIVPGQFQNSEIAWITIATYEKYVYALLKSEDSRAKEQPYVSQAKLVASNLKGALDKLYLQCQVPVNFRGLPVGAI